MSQPSGSVTFWQCTLPLLLSISPKLILEYRAQASEADSGEGGEDLGRGMGQGGQGGGLAEAHAAARVRGFASSMGGGADLLVDRSKQEDEQGLREAVRQRGGVRLRRNDTAYGEAIGTWLRIFKQFRKGNSQKFTCTEFSEVRRWASEGGIMLMVERVAR